MNVRRVPALLLINALFVVPLCTLGCTPSPLTVAVGRSPAQDFQCHGSSSSAVPDKDTPDSDPYPVAPCTHCAHLLDAVKRGDSSPLLTLTVSDYYELSPTTVSLQQTQELKQRSHLDGSSPPLLTSALRI